MSEPGKSFRQRPLPRLRPIFLTGFVVSWSMISRCSAGIPTRQRRLPGAGV